ncbi:MAG: sigma-70 family RNA polymerase sigma factor [Oscillospiraceae bacterium]|nr:sigma-70 family RNA polymerase sigma factor [Oscillospiraceae bacterium]
MTRDEEKNIILKAQKGDIAAFEKLVSANEAFVYNLAFRTLRNEQDAQDAAQEVFIKVWTSLSSFRGDSKFSVWLYRITNNVCTDILRRRKNDVVSLFTEDETGEATYTCSLCSHSYTVELPKKVSEITNEQSDATLSVPAGSNAYVPDGTVFEVVELPAEEVPERVLGEIALEAEGSVKPLAMYDLAMLLDGAEIQPDGKVIITLPPLQYDHGYDKLIVVYIAPDGSYEECPTTQNEDGTVSFETTHFSKYAVIGISEEQKVNTGAVVGIIIGAVLILGCGGFFGYHFIIRKKKA